VLFVDNAPTLSNARYWIEDFSVNIIGVFVVQDVEIHAEQQLSLCLNFGFGGTHHEINTENFQITQMMVVLVQHAGPPSFKDSNALLCCIGGIRTVPCGGEKVCITEESRPSGVQLLQRRLLLPSPLRVCSHCGEDFHVPKDTNARGM
jgi:hypothetical protein